MRNLALAWRLAARDMRGGLAGLRLVLACLTIGVAAIATVGSVSEAMLAGLAREARTLLGGDVDLRLIHLPASPAQRAYLEANAAAVSEIARMRAMAHRTAPGDRRQLVELKAVDAAYPLVGTLLLEPAMPPAAAMDERDGIWGAAADRDLLDRLGLVPGDRLRLGDAEFAVRAAIVDEPDRVTSLFNLGPRLIIAARALPDTGLVRPGSQIRYHYRVALPADADSAPWIEALAEAFPQASWRIREVGEAAPGVRRFIARMTLFLTFCGLATLLVGGVGVGNAVAGYLEGRTATIATLKAVGAPGATVLAIFLFQVLGVALAAIAAGVLVGAAAPFAVVFLLGDRLPLPPELALYAAPLAVAAAFGLLTAATFALWPLARAREIPPALLFRHKAAPVAGRPRPRFLAAVAVGGVLLAALTVATADDPRAALWFVGGSLAVYGLLRLLVRALVRLGGRSRRAATPVWRLAATSLTRPGAATSSVVVALGMGLSVLVAVTLIQGNLGRQITDRLAEKAPALFFLDIQPDQVAAFEEIVRAVPGAHDLQRAPSLRGRIVRIDGMPVEEASIAPDAAWAVRGDRSLTYSSRPPENAVIVAGRWWPEDYAGPPLVSFDADLAQGFDVGIGDTLTFNILGREITTEIASLREIDWRSLRFDFTVYFSPGTLEGAPHSHIAAVRASAGAEAAIERAVTERFANVSVVRVREALESAARILETIGAAIRGAASVALVAGALVLAGAVASGRRQRTYEAVVFKALGATRWRVLKAYLLEFGVLGLSTGLIGVLAGALASWAVVVHLMETDWVFLPRPAAATVLACIALTLVAGFLGTWRALGGKAAPHLRND
jgi:putative ABC transport system permease protein